MSRIERKAFKARVEGPCEFQAVIATLGVVDSDGDVIAPGAFAGVGRTPVLWGHDQSMIPLGKCSVAESGDLVVATGEISDGRACRWLRQDVADGDPVQEWSWGFVPTEFRHENVDGRRVRVIERVDLLEVSGVLRGASVGTRTLGVKSDCGCGCGGSCGTDAAAVVRAGVEAALARIKREGAVGWRTSVPSAGAGLGDAVLRGAEALGIPAPEVLEVRRAPVREADVRTRSECAGWLEYDRRRPTAAKTMFVRADLDLEETLVTAGHELAHAFEAHHGLPEDEEACEAYGRAFAYAATYGTPMPDEVRPADA